jgi:hypothetical protein
MAIVLLEHGYTGSAQLGDSHQVKPTGHQVGDNAMAHGVGSERIGQPYRSRLHRLKNAYFANASRGKGQLLIAAITSI